jgi:hypothetical protein
LNHVGELEGLVHLFKGKGLWKKNNQAWNHKPSFSKTSKRLLKTPGSFKTDPIFRARGSALSLTKKIWGGLCMYITDIYIM